MYLERRYKRVHQLCVEGNTHLDSAGEVGEGVGTGGGGEGGGGEGRRGVAISLSLPLPITPLFLPSLPQLHYLGAREAPQARARCSTVYIYFCLFVFGLDFPFLLLCLLRQLGFSVF